MGRLHSNRFEFLIYDLYFWGSLFFPDPKTHPSSSRGVTSYYHHLSLLPSRSVSLCIYPHYICHHMKAQSSVSSFIVWTVTPRAVFIFPGYNSHPFLNSKIVPHRIVEILPCHQENHLYPLSLHLQCSLCLVALLDTWLSPPWGQCFPCPAVSCGGSFLSHTFPLS